MSDVVSAVPKAFATSAEFKRRFPNLCESGAGADTNTLNEIMVETSAFIEDMTDRRLAPFSGHIFTDLLNGIDPNEYGASTDSPLDIYGSLGLSQASAYGADNLVRHFWLDQTAPHYPELWSYTIESITLYLTFGNVIQVIPTSQIEGPQPDTGHCRLRLGTFAPEGTTLEVIYGGGYTGGIPPSLKQLCLFQAAQVIILSKEPQTREGMDLKWLNQQIEKLMASWAKS